MDGWKQKRYSNDSRDLKAVNPPRFSVRGNGTGWLGLAPKTNVLAVKGMK
jgi:hypothetical protein